MSLCLAGLASVLWLVIPAVTTVSGTQSVVQEIGAESTPEPGVPRYSVRSASLLEEQGRGVLPALAAPVLVASLPVLLRGVRGVRVLRVVAAVLLLMFAVVTGFSIGLYYFPSAVTMIAAAATR